jgi:hypothetical protein
MDSYTPASRRPWTRTNGKRVVRFNPAGQRQNAVFHASEKCEIAVKPRIQCLHCGKVFWTSGVSVNTNACMSAHLRHCQVYKDMRTGEADLDFNELLVKSQVGT